MRGQLYPWIGYMKCEYGDTNEELKLTAERHPNFSITVDHPTGFEVGKSYRVEITLRVLE